MTVSEALQYGRSAKHCSGKARAEAYPDLAFSILTIEERSFVIGAHPHGLLINGVAYNEKQIQRFTAMMLERGIRFDEGWFPLHHQIRSRHRSSWEHLTGLVGTCFLVLCLVLRRLWMR